MPRIIEKTVFQFSELSEKAKNKAREWFRASTDSIDLASVISDFVAIAGIIGLELDTRSVRLMNGKSRQECQVYYSVGYCQSDYAAFSGTWKYKPGCFKAIREYAPQDAKLHAIISEWCAMQKPNFYRVRAICSERRGNQYVNEVLKWYSSRYDEEAVNADVEREAANIVDQLAAWLYASLRAEVDYQNSDEYVDENITANEYEFYVDGGIAQ